MVEAFIILGLVLVALPGLLPIVFSWQERKRRKAIDESKPSEWI